MSPECLDRDNRYPRFRDHLDAISAKKIVFRSVYMQILSFSGSAITGITFRLAVYLSEGEKMIMRSYILNILFVILNNFSAKAADFSIHALEETPRLQTRSLQREC